MRAITLLFLLFCTSLLSAADYYVAKDGSDANDGSETSPFLTISKAAGLMVAGDVCYIKEGVYREVLSPANGGTEANPITFRAFGEDKVIISATEELSGWQNLEGNIWKTAADIEFGRRTMLYYNAEPMDNARWPNNTDGDPFTIDAMTVEGGSANTIVATNLPAGADITDGYVWYLGAHSGASWTQPINSVSGNTITHVANDISRWPFNPHNPTVFRNENRGRFFLFGDKDLLDYPQEWYFDAAADEVFFIAPSNADPNDATVEYASRERTVLLGKEWIVVEGLTTFGGIVNIKAENCIIRNCEIRHGLQSLDELGNTDAQVSEGAVYIQASNTLIEDNLIEGGSLNGISVQGWAGETGVVIMGNEIREFNTVGNHSSPIRCRATNSKVISNTIVGGGRDGIFIPTNNSEIAWNDVSDVMRINNDGGLFYVVGNEDDKNTSIHHNWFHDSFGPDYADGRCAGIYLDNDSKGYDVHHNVVWNISWSAVQMNWDAWNNDIFNNTFWNVDLAMGIWLNGRVHLNNRVWNNYTPVGPWEGQDVADNIIDPMDNFVDLANNDFRPNDNSPMVNAGRIIPGITDGYRGAAPEVGAYERGAEQWIPGAPRADGVVTGTSNVPRTRVRAQTVPNPTVGETQISFSLRNASALNWKLVSAHGQVLKTGSQELPAGGQRLEIDLTDLPSGTYLFSGATEEGRVTQVIVRR
ncbi:T9SS type A sorting domain-containing protein [Neolewinella aurantiaca]|uniref:T9SS type A sorting domain-containing protein n=1 Tax=Neolewinella aurantiaca TaxID=2602767 RepID=A0A5C7FMZ2_9BACT|nr:T9SS type A sorting domain-containing protein [Neolewinella aurantiaca]TXF86686.1 T9SS type A sorting domain-containing protein [Neolewinella aurantiaca]